MNKELLLQLLVSRLLVWEETNSMEILLLLVQQGTTYQELCVSSVLKDIFVMEEDR